MLAVAFLGLVGLMIFCVWQSGDALLQKLGLVLLTAWATTNVAVELSGFHRAMLYIPSIQAVLAGMTTIVSMRTRRITPLAVLVLYILMGLGHVLFFAAHKDGTHWHYVMVNVAFTVQLLVVGGAGARTALRRWVPGGDQRLGSDRAFRARVARR